MESISVVKAIFNSSGLFPLYCKLSIPDISSMYWDGDRRGVGERMCVYLNTVHLKTHVVTLFSTIKKLSYGHLVFILSPTCEQAY